MSDRAYEPPSITEIGSVADLTLQIGGADGFIFVIPGVGQVPSDDFPFSSG